jgi:hypothetical protein
MTVKSKLMLLVFLLLALGVSYSQQPINLVDVGGTALGAVSNYGTSPGAVAVIGVNAFITNSPAVTGSGVFEVGPTTAANTATNPFYHNLSDGTNTLTANAITTWGSAPTGKVLGVNADILGPVDGSGYVEVDCKTGCGTTTTISLVPQTSGGLSVGHFVAAASNNATSLKASAGQVYSIDGYNNAAYPVYFKLYNTASSPSSCGSTNLFKVVGFQAGTQHTLQSEEGWAMGTGIGYCLTKGIADTDNTAVLLSDAVIDIGYK